MKKEPTKKEKSVPNEEPRFYLGVILLTRRAREVLTQEDIYKALDRHRSGDWGEVTPQEWIESDNAIKHGHRILSQYQSDSGVKFWVFTEWDQSNTTILLPKEYRPEEELFIEDDSILED